MMTMYACMLICMALGVLFGILIGTKIERKMWLEAMSQLIQELQDAVKAMEEGE